MKLWPIVCSVLGPGIGQALVGRRVAAIVFAATAALATFAVALTIYAVPVLAAVWIASIAHIVVYVTRTTDTTRRKPEAVLVWVALVVVAGVTKAVLAETFTFPSSSMLPTFEIDDHVVFSKLGAYERGDIIVFAHPCQPQTYGKRIVAVANDTVEMRCSRLYLNGKPVEETLVRAKDGYRDRDFETGEWRPGEASRYRETIGGKTFEIYDELERPAVADGKDFPLEALPRCDDFATEAKPIAGTIVETKPGAAPCELQRHYVVPAGHVFVMGDFRSNSNDSRFWGPVPVDSIRGKAIGILRPLSRFGAL